MYIPIKYLWSGSGSGSTSGSSNITDYIVDSETINPEYNNVYDYGKYNNVQKGHGVYYHIFIFWLVLILIIILTYICMGVILLCDYIKTICKNKNKITPLINNDISTNNDNCSICLIQHNNTSKKLECNHIFHYECIKRWKITSINNNNIAKCPICRVIISNDYL